jgi:dCTP diphosphatase
MLLCVFTSSIEMRLPTSFSLLLQTLRQFIQERNWEQFHTPRNISLALTGECGELSAIFQWKSDSESIFQDEFTAKELTHLGEEIADVFIYNLRLSDVVGIDLMKAIRSVLDSSTTTDQNFRQALKTSTDLTFAETLVLINHSADVQTMHSSVRDLLFHLNSCQGKISNIFATNGSAKPTIDHWSEEDISELAINLSRISIILLQLASLASLDMANILKDKIAKNAAKYPAHLVKGSSKKYDAYPQSLSRRFFSSKIFTSPMWMFGWGALSSLLFVLTGVVMLVENEIESVTVDV